MNSVDLDAGAAATIAEGMRKVAVADGSQLHPNEIRLIETFEADLPDDALPTFIGDSAVREVYLKSLVMVALADGRISDAEYAVIAELAAGIGADDAELDAVVSSVKQEFLDVFAGVTHFRDQVQTVAEELGVKLD